MEVESTWKEMKWIQTSQTVIFPPNVSVLYLYVPMSDQKILPLFNQMCMSLQNAVAKRSCKWAFGLGKVYRDIKQEMKPQIWLIVKQIWLLPFNKTIETVRLHCFVIS